MALTVLEATDERGDGGVDPLRYDRKVRAGFAKALTKGEATMAPDCRLFITEHGNVGSISMRYTIAKPHMLFRLKPTPTHDGSCTRHHGQLPDHSDRSTNPLTRLDVNTTRSVGMGLDKATGVADFDSAMRRFESSRPSQ